jgi:hypothetical protein
MRNESIRTAAFVAAAAALVIAAAVFEPESRPPEILSDQGEPFYPKFTDPREVKTIEVVDYDEATATARPFQVAFEKGRWILPSHHNYVVDAGERLAKTAAALVDLRKDLVSSDSPADHARFGVIDPLDQKTATLTGRGKRVTLRDARREVLADFIFGKPVEGKPGFRYTRVPGQKRTYAVKTGADPSARFADWVDAGLLRIAAASLRKVTIHSYSINEQLGRLDNAETITLNKEGGEWKAAGAEKISAPVVAALTATLDNLKIVDARPKPPSLAANLKTGQLTLSLETAMSLRQRGYFLAPNGRLLANEGELVAETANGLSYVLRFGEIATSSDSQPAAKPAKGGENRYLFVTVSFDAARAQKYSGDAAAGERLARDLTNRFADWYYVISGADFEKLRVKRKDLIR